MSVRFRSLNKAIGDPSIFKLIRRTTVTYSLTEEVSTFDLSCEENTVRRELKLDICFEQ